MCSEAEASEQVKLVNTSPLSQKKFEWFDPFLYDRAALASTNVR